jgi:hypothetical protein
MCRVLSRISRVASPWVLPEPPHGRPPFPYCARTAEAGPQLSSLRNGWQSGLPRAADFGPIFTLGQPGPPHRGPQPP